MANAEALAKPGPIGRSSRLVLGRLPAAARGVDAVLALVVVAVAFDLALYRNLCGVRPSAGFSMRWE